MSSVVARFGVRDRDADSEDRASVGIVPSAAGPGREWLAEVAATLGTAIRA